MDKKELYGYQLLFLLFCQVHPSFGGQNGYCHGRILTLLYSVQEMPQVYRLIRYSCKLSYSIRF